MSFDVYFVQDGDMWVESVQDANHVQFNFIKVEDEAEYLAIIGLLAAKQAKRNTLLKKKIKDFAPIAQLDQSTCLRSKGLGVRIPLGVPVMHR